MESNNSIEELIIRYLQNEIQEDELRVLDAWIHESDANKAHFFELKGLFDTRKEVAFLNHYSVERSWERMAGKLDAISGVSVKSKVLGKQFWLSFLRYADDIYYVNRKEYVDWAVKALTVIRSVWNTFSGEGESEWREAVHKEFIIAGITPKDYLNFVCNKKLKDI